MVLDFDGCAIVLLFDVCFVVCLVCLVFWVWVWFVYGGCVDVLNFVLVITRLFGLVCGWVIWIVLVGLILGVWYYWLWGLVD